MPERCEPSIRSGRVSFVREPKAMEQAESVREPVDLAVSESTQPERLEPETTDSAPAPPELADTPATPAKPDASVVPTLISEPVAFYPADKNGLPYDITVERLHVDQLQPEIPAPPARNFRIIDEHLGEGGPKQKFARNVEAIRTLQTLENENRNATPEEQEILSQYVGWGGLADAFDPDKDSWAKEYKELKGLLSEDEYAAARASTLNAHYTSPTVIRAIYDAVGTDRFHYWQYPGTLLRRGQLLRDAAGEHGRKPFIWRGAGQHLGPYRSKDLPGSQYHSGRF